MKHLENNCIHFIKVPANRTAGYSTAKDFLRQKFQSWYADKISKQLKTEQGCGKNPVDLRLSGKTTVGTLHDKNV